MISFYSYEHVTTTEHGGLVGKRRTPDIKLEV